MKNINLISSFNKKQKKLLKKSMTKKDYQSYCRRYRAKMTLGKNYGTRSMSSSRDIERKRRKGFFYEEDIE